MIRFERLSTPFVVVTFLSLLALGWTPALGAQETETGKSPPIVVLPEELRQRPLVIGTKQAPPFAMRSPDGVWHGLSIDLWRAVAQDLGLTFEIEERDLEGLVTGLEDGSLDAAVAALTVTAEREKTVDFCHPFYSSGLGIAVAPERGLDAWRVLSQLVSPALLKAVGTLVLVLFFTGFLIWLFERKRNEAQFGGKSAKGLGHAFWWSAVTMTTVGYGDKAPVTVGGRTIALFWMFLSVVIISGFTGAIASSLTLASFRSPVEGPDDLPRVRVAALAGSATTEVLDLRSVGYRAFASVEEALDALEDEEIEAVVHDEPILQYLVKQRAEAGDEALELVAETFEVESYAFALPQGSPLREPLNRRILERLSGPFWREAQRRYLGE